MSTSNGALPVRDIVERLRMGHTTHHQVSRDGEQYETVSRTHLPPPLQTEAAEEIERLRKCLSDSDAALALKAAEKWMIEADQARAYAIACHDALTAVMKEWVNGRKVADGISLTVRQQADAALEKNPSSSVPLSVSAETPRIGLGPVTAADTLAGGGTNADDALTVPRQATPEMLAAVSTTVGKNTLSKWWTQMHDAATSRISSFNVTKGETP